MTYTDLGNGQGFIYAVNKDSIIEVIMPNDKQGLMRAKSTAMQSRPIAAGRRGFFTIVIGEITAPGEVGSLSINGVEAISGPVSYLVGQEAQLAADLAAAISAHFMAPGVNYIARSIDNKVVAFAGVAATASINGHVVNMATSGGVDFAVTNVDGVVKPGLLLDELFGYRFYYSPSETPLTSMISAEDVTKYLVPVTIDNGLHTVESTISDGVISFERLSALTHVLVSPESGGTDTLTAIDPESFADGDVIFLYSDDSVSVSPGGNLLLKNDTDVLLGGAGTAVLLKKMGGDFIELIRSSSVSLVVPVPYLLLIDLIDSSALVPGMNYLIVDRGDNGIMVHAVSVDRVSVMASYFAALPDWQNESGLFQGVWDVDAPSYPVGSVVTWGQGLMYQNITGANGASSPNVDVVNWQVLLRQTSPLYMREIHSVHYNVTEDYIVQRSDARGNIVTQSPLAIASIVPVSLPEDMRWFVWGNDNVRGNHVRYSYWSNSNASMSYRGGLFQGNTIVRSRIDMIMSDECEFVLNHMDSALLAASFTPSVRLFGMIESTLKGGWFIPDGKTTFFMQSVEVNAHRSPIAQPIYLRYESASDGIIHITGNDIVRIGVNDGNFSNFTVTGRMSDLTVQRSVSDGAINAGGQFGVIEVTTLVLESFDNITVGAGGEDPIITMGTICVKPVGGGELLLTGSFVADVTIDNNVVIPNRLWDDPAAVPPSAGEVRLNSVTGDYAILRIVSIGGVRAFVVENVIKNG